MRRGSPCSMKILYRPEIEKLLSIDRARHLLEEGFVLYSRGETEVPPSAALHFQDPPGDCHIKFGSSKKSPYYVIKIASGFPQNPFLGLPAGNGMMLLFDKQTGRPAYILLDEGYLTDIRTAIAGSIAAKYLAPKKVSCIGIVGTGAQAQYQLKYLNIDCRKVMVWGRDPLKIQKFCEMADFDIQGTTSLEQLIESCNLIITTTSSTKPLIRKVRKGTHITAVGADDIGKQELDPHLFTHADRIVVDSRTQCRLYGDVSYALRENLIQPDQIIELGEVIQNPALGRTSDDQITIADLTGLAIQDLQIATAFI